jgi:hypothetical protein
MRDFIISEIKRLTSENGGTAPGVGAFATATGITAGKWRGVYWAKWSDALTEAGVTANEWQRKRDSNEILYKVAELCRLLRKMPTTSEMKLHARSDPSFPNTKTVTNHFGGVHQVVAALRSLSTSPDYADLAAILPPASNEHQEETRARGVDGAVYLMKSGQHYKIGRSDDIERRFREITIALPESVTLIHTIRTDDPSGIEAYWHRRFADRRANGEWFKLSGEDVKAFRRRSFQ